MVGEGPGVAGLGLLLPPKMAAMVDSIMALMMAIRSPSEARTSAGRLIWCTAHGERAR
jgi:hypothetical protein